MSYQATVFKVMIASPSDVKEEREIFREVIAEWNVLNADSRKVVLLPIGWETHSYSEMGDRPQAVINKQVLKDCDLVVGVFKTRIGTSTGKYNSGTIEEIEEHLKEKKPVMLFFGPITREDFNREQYEQLEEFRKSFKGLYCDYKDEEDFRKQFQRELSLRLNNKEFQSSLENIFIKASSELQLTHEAQELLYRAAKSDGNIVKGTNSDGTFLQVKSGTIVVSEDNKEIATWEYALELLIKNKLLQKPSFRDSIYKVTYEGYKVADKIESEILPFSEEAKLLLATGFIAKDKIINKQKQSGKFIIYTDFVEYPLVHMDDPSKKRLWEAVLEELLTAGLIEEISTKSGKKYELTSQGCKIALLIKPQYY